MKICLVTTEFISEESDFDGGLANYIYKIAKYLIKEGHQVIVVLQSDKNLITEYKAIPLYKVKINTNGRVYKFIRNHSALRESLDWFASSYKLNKYLFRLQEIEHFDVIHYSSFRATGFFRLKNTPCLVRVSSIHSSVSEAMGIKQDSVENKFMNFLETAALKKADIVIGPNESINNLLESNTGRKVLLVEQLFDFVESSALELSNEYKFLENKKYLLFIGKLNKLKGADKIAEVINELLKQNSDLYFVFAGRDAGYKDLIINNAGMYKDRLIFTDRIRKEILNPIIKYSAGIVIPSKNDNFPNVAVEAMQLGKVVIGTYSSGFKQIIENNKEGFLVDENSSIELLSIINKLLNLSNEDKERMEDLAKQSISRLNPDNIVKATITAYNKAIETFTNNHT